MFEAMKAKYRGKTGEEAIRAAYPNLRTFEAALNAAVVKPEKAAKGRAAKPEPQAEEADPRD
jgi:hypothetical protein